MKIDREIACNVLTDNFCLLYGEKFRQLFETNGQKLIDLGIENAKIYFTEYAINNTSKTHLSTMVRFFKPNKDIADTYIPFIEMLNNNYVIEYFEIDNSSYWRQRHRYITFDDIIDNKYKINMESIAVYVTGKK